MFHSRPSDFNLALWLSIAISLDVVHSLIEWSFFQFSLQSWLERFSMYEMERSFPDSYIFINNVVYKFTLLLFKIDFSWPLLHANSKCLTMPELLSRFQAMSIFPNFIHTNPFNSLVTFVYRPFTVSSNASSVPSTWTNFNHMWKSQYLEHIVRIWK